MNGKIMLFISVLITFLLMILSSISALEYNEIVHDNKSKLKDTLVNESIEDLKIRILNILKELKII